MPEPVFDTSPMAALFMAKVVEDKPVKFASPACLLLKLLQSVLLSLPGLAALATGRLKVCTPAAETMPKSVPAVPVAKVCEVAVSPLSEVNAVAQAVVDPLV